MSDSSQPQPGDIVNGHKLSDDGTSWVPVSSPDAVPPAPPAAATPADNKTPKKNWFARHKVLTGVLAAVVVIGGISVVTSDGSESADSGTTEQAEPATGSDSDTEDAASDMPAIGDKVRDGDFEFKVTDVQTGVSNVGGQYGQSAQGEFTVVTLKVENIGDEPQSFLDDSQKGFNNKGQEVSADSAAGIYANQDASNLYEELNPGNSATIKLVFDLPASQQLASLELHDSMFSDGVQVSVN